MGTREAEDDLICRAQAGDSPAFAALCERHRGRVWRIIASVARGADIEDLAQEAIVRAFCALRSYRGDAPFEAWLCRIALNIAHDYQRSAWRRRVTLWYQPLLPDVSDPAETPEAATARREQQRRVRAAVARLPERQRVPIWLHYFEEFALAEVARLESTSESTIRSRVQAGLRRLNRDLGDLLEDAAEEPLAREARPKGCGA